MSGDVSWDSNLCALFGLDESGFVGTFDGWIELIDESDRDRVRAIIADAVRDAASFRFDHRCVWPDGSVHWVEGIGEVLVDHGEVIGAFGLAMDVDDRHRQIDERNRLVELERRQRQRVEFIASVHDVLALSVDTDEIVGRITTSVVPDVAEWCSIVVSMDRPPQRPLIRVAHRDPDQDAVGPPGPTRLPLRPGCSLGCGEGHSDATPRIHRARRPAGLRSPGR